MKFKYIFLAAIIAAAFIGIMLHTTVSVAEIDHDHDSHNEDTVSPDIYDHSEHEMEAGHEGHDDDMHDEQEQTDEDNNEDHNIASDIHDHDAHEESDTRGSHEGHGHSDEAFIDLMTAAETEEAGITTDTIQAGTISRQIKLTGEVIFNQDRIVHLVPRISGVVASVNKKLGDSVKKGDKLAVIHSRELTDIKSEYLSALERIANAKINFERDESLWQKKIIPERQFLESKQNYIETRIAMQAAERKLHALGFSENYITQLPDQPHETLFQYILTAPADGTIIEKHMVQGELVTTESPVFIIADTNSLWVDLQVYPKDLPSIRPGQKVFVSAQNDSLTAEGIISFLSPVISRETRTALARVELSNKDSMWRAGLFATAIVTPEQNNGSHTYVVPKTALQNIDGKPSVFIVTPEGYFPVTVTTGESNSTHAEILSGVSPGQTYVSNGSFELKAKLVTSTMGGHAGHGH